jgi:hypothetical protein
MPVDPAIVEEYALLDHQVVAFKSKLKRHDELRKEILAGYESLDGAETAIAKGQTYDALISEADNKREITQTGKTKLRKLWGIPTFLLRCQIALKHLPDPHDPGNLYSISTKTGPRHVSVVPAQAELKLAA